MTAADRSDYRFNDWLQRMVSAHYPSFGNSKRLDLPSGDHLLIPEEIEPISQQAAMPIAADALTSPVDPAYAAVIPRGSDWRITLGYAAVLQDASYPAFHGKHHSGIDICALRLLSKRRYMPCAPVPGDRRGLPAKGLRQHGHS